MKLFTELAKYLKDTFGIEIHNLEYFQTAFTHKSYVNEHPRESQAYYERTEFLGDAVMQLCVSEYIFKKFPNLPEGKMSRLRAAMVCEDSFSKFALECHFDEYIRLGKGEEKANARKRPALLCDIFEAFIGALYLDTNKETVVKFINQVVFPKLDMGWFDVFLDYKTELQEFLQRDGSHDIVYEEVSAIGPDNDRTYEMSVLCDGELLGKGQGKTKKSAEQSAAHNALNSFDDFKEIRLKGN